MTPHRLPFPVRELQNKSGKLNASIGKLANNFAARTFSLQLEIFKFQLELAKQAKEMAALFGKLENQMGSMSHKRPF